MSNFVHMELNTADPAAAKEFYAAVFGWTYQDMQMPDGTYSMIITPTGPGIGGIQQNPMPDAPSQWVGYVGVESIARTIEVVEANGGRILMPETEVHGMGKLTVFSDPSGAVCAAWEPAQKPASDKPTAKKKAGTSKKKASAAKKKAAAKQAPVASKKKAAAKKAPAASKKKAAAKKAPAASKKKAAAKKAPAASKKKAAAKKAPAASKKKAAAKKKSKK